MSHTVIPTTAFVRQLKAYAKSHPQSRKTVQTVLELLAVNAHAPSLHSHKLQGTLDGMWSCKAGYDLRIIFEFQTIDGVESILLHSIGTHDQVY